METSFFLNGVHFSKRECMSDTFLKNARGITQRPKLLCVGLLRTQSLKKFVDG